MRYVIVFDSNNRVSEMVHFTGLELNPEEEIKQMNLKEVKYKRASESIFTELIGEDWTQDKINFIELDEEDKMFFNKERYDTEMSILEDDNTMTME